MIWPSISYLYKYNQHICSLQANFHQISDPANGQKLNYFLLVELHIFNDICFIFKHLACKTLQVYKHCSNHNYSKLMLLTTKFKDLKIVQTPLPYTTGLAL